MLGFGAEHRRRRRPNNDTKSYLFLFFVAFRIECLFIRPCSNFYEKFFFATYIFSCAGTEAAVPDQMARQQLQRPTVGVRNFGAQPGALKMCP